MHFDGLQMPPGSFTIKLAFSGEGSAIYVDYFSEISPSLLN